jgi:hypothetical protein
MTIKNDALAIVPLNISKLEAIPVNRSRNLTADDKKRLLNIYNKKMGENCDLLRAKRNEVECAVLNAEKDKANLTKFRAEMDALEEQIETLGKRRQVISLRCENATGFTIDGSLLNRASRGYGSNDEANKVWDLRHRQGLNKADAIRDKVEMAKQAVDRFGLKFDKVETRLVCATTIGEGMDIMEAVLGNGDDILKAEDICSTAEVSE